MNNEWIVNTPIAHRGLHSQGIPENSIAAFEAAAAAGYAIELDVRAIKGGAIVVFHDDTLERMTGRNGFVRDLEATNLKETRLFGNAECIPLLETVFERVKTPICIEVKRLKNDDFLLERRLLSLIRHFEPNVTVASFDPKSLIWFRKNAPDIPRGVISCNFADETRSAYEKFRLRNLFDLRAIKPSFISYELNSLPAWRVSMARKFYKIPVLAWTIANDDDREKAKNVADNIIFEGIKP
jgi:glycerophosphoryl diester phosphodiesterase